MLSRNVLFLALTCAAVAFGVKWVLPQRSQAGIEAAQLPDFEDIGPGIRRLNYLWRPAPLVQVPDATFLINITDETGATSLVLVDAGPPEPLAVRNLLQQLHAAAEVSPLRLLIVTHGHLDHVGALTELQSAFPELAIIMHAAEAPFLLSPAQQQARYSAVPSDNAAYTVLRTLLEQLMSQPEAAANRTFLLSGHFPWATVQVLARPACSMLTVEGGRPGRSGDLVEAQAGGQRPPWLPPTGVLSFLHVPGHSPGQIAVMHEPSGVLMCSDVVMHGRGLVGLHAPGLHVVPGLATANVTQAHLDAEALSALHFVRLFPSHDTGEGVPPSALSGLVASFS